MAVEIDLAPRHGPFAGTLDPAAIDQYAAATNDTNAPVATGTAVPGDVPGDPDLRRAVGGERRGAARRCTQSGRNGVHGEHEVLLHRPLVPGEALETFSEPFAVRNTTRRRARRAAHGAVRRRRRAGGRALVDDLLPRLRRARRRGPGATRPHLPRRRHARIRSGSVTQHVDLDAAHPLRRGVERLVGAPLRPRRARARPGVDYLFAHGLCTMAMCTQAAVGVVADGDPARRPSRSRCGSASPTRLDADLTVDVYDARKPSGRASTRSKRPARARP